MDNVTTTVTSTCRELETIVLAVGLLITAVVGVLIYVRQELRKLFASKH